MLEQSQKLTDGLIIYSVLVSDHENLILRMMHLRVSVQTILIQAAKSKRNYRNRTSRYGLQDVLSADEG